MAHLYDHKVVSSLPCQSVGPVGHIELCTCTAALFICFDCLMAEILNTSLSCVFFREALLNPSILLSSVFPHSPALLSAHLVSGSAFVDVIQFPIVHSALQE